MPHAPTPPGVPVPPPWGPPPQEPLEDQCYLVLTPSPGSYGHPAPTTGRSPAHRPALLVALAPRGQRSAGEAGPEGRPCRVVGVGRLAG